MTNASLIRELLRTGFGHNRNMDAKTQNAYLIKLVTDLRSSLKNNPDLDIHAKAVTLIVANTLWDAYIKTGNVFCLIFECNLGSKHYLYEMSALLEFIFDCCSNVFIAAILLMRVYTLLGNMDRIVALFNQLDIK